MGTASEQILQPTINHNDAIALAEQNLARLQGILNQKLMLGYGATSVGSLQYTIQQLQGYFRVEAQPLSARGRDSTGASGSIFTIQYRNSGSEQYKGYAFNQEISDASWDAKGNLGWSNFRKDTEHPLSNQQSTNHGITATDQAGKWQVGHRPGSGLTSHNPVEHFNKYGHMMRTSAFGIGQNGNRPFVGSHTWSAIYEEGHKPQYQGVGPQWFPAVGY